MFKDLKALSLITNSPASEKGRTAFYAGQPETANPFTSQTGLYDEWRFGWADAKRATAAANTNAKAAEAS